MSKLLLDTNVLIYAIDQDSQYFSQSRSLLDGQDYDLYTTSKNLTELLAVTTRGPEPPLSIEDALAVIEDYSLALSILFPNDQSFSIFRDLISKHRPTGLKMHDFEIISIAIANNIQSVATFDIKDFKAVEEIELLSF